MIPSNFEHDKVVCEEILDYRKVFLKVNSLGIHGSCILVLQLWCQYLPKALKTNSSLWQKIIDQANARAFKKSSHFWEKNIRECIR